MRGKGSDGERLLRLPRSWAKHAALRQAITVGLQWQVALRELVKVSGEEMVISKKMGGDKGEGFSALLAIATRLELEDCRARQVVRD
jgi:hypothetical protein